MLPEWALTKAVALYLVLTVARAQVTGVPKKKQLVRIPKQIASNPTVINTEQDHQSDETGGGQHLFGGTGAALGHGKYFQDMYTLQYGPKQLEYGHVCEDPQEWQLRYERKDHEKKHYIGQARWGDKHGGYGEHYWDYNHAGHHGHGGGGEGAANDEESHDEDEGDGGYSHHVPDYVTPSEVNTPVAMPHTHRPTASDERVKRQPDSDPAAKLVSPTIQGPISLIYDAESGTVVNEATGQSYILHPVD